MQSTVQQPAIVLVRPQLGENIGKAARAMLNFGLTDLRLVAPRDGWPNPDAGPSAAGAGDVIAAAKVYETLEEAIADCTDVYATTVRDRNMPKPVVTAAEAATRIYTSMENGRQVAVMFGPERSGLTNDDTVLADTVLTVPVNPVYGSLNLAQAVILVAYELFQKQDETPSFQAAHPEGPANKQELLGLMEHLEEKLDDTGFFRSEDRRDSMRRTLRNLVQNASFSSQEVQTLRGVVKALSRKRRD